MLWYLLCREACSKELAYGPREMFMIILRSFTIVAALFFGYLAINLGDGAYLVVAHMLRGGASVGDQVFGLAVVIITFLVTIGTAWLWWGTTFDGSMNAFPPRDDLVDLSTLTLYSGLVYILTSFVYGVLVGPIANFGLDPYVWTSRWNILMFIGALPLAIAFWTLIVDMVRGGWKLLFGNYPFSV